MKAPFPVLAILGVVVGLLTDVSVRGSDPTFEEIEFIKTNLEPCGGMVNRGDGYFYGAARWVENKRGGAIFRIAPRQNAEVLHTFSPVVSGNDINYGGASPSCSLVAGPEGAFYGATDSAGAHGNGTIYRISVDGVFSVVYDLLPTDGQSVGTLLVTTSGEIYGTTSWGGARGGGTLFRIGTDGVFETLYAFSDDLNLPPGTPLPPYSPQTLHEGTDGKIYGTTNHGGEVESPAPFKFTYGAFYRYDGPNAITVLSHFGGINGNPTSSAVAADGFYLATYHKLLHLAFDGTLSVLSDFGTAQLLVGSIMVTPGGVYALSTYGGANASGFVFRYLPEDGTTTTLHDFTSEYAYRNRCLVPGNDGLIYGLAAFPEGYALSASARVASTTASASLTATTPITGNKPRTFRFRELANQSANFVPVAKPDAAWLPTALSPRKERVVTVDVLANDRDPDMNPLRLAGVIPPDTGYAELVSVAGRQRVRFVTSEADPASRWLRYLLADGQGGTATGYVAIQYPGAGKYVGKARDISHPAAPSATLTVNIGTKNVINTTYVLGGLRYTGKGLLEMDETADLALTLEGQSPLNLHLSLRRGTPRQVIATVQGDGSVYTATCPQTKK